MENEITSFASNKQNYEVYKVMLDQIKEIQVTMDNLDREAKKENPILSNWRNAGISIRS